MNSHNYGLDDFATYSQDPEWRKLQKQAYPDYELPPLTQENARNQLIDYMNAKQLWTRIDLKPIHKTQNGESYKDRHIRL